MADRDRENSSPISWSPLTVLTYIKPQLWHPLSSELYQGARQTRHLYKVLEIYLYKMGPLNSYHEYILAKVEVPPCDAFYAQLPSESQPARRFVYVQMERSKEREKHLISVVEGLDSSDEHVRKVSCEMIYNSRPVGPFAALKNLMKDKFAEAKTHPTYVQFLKDLEMEVVAPSRVFKLNLPPAANGSTRNSISSSSRSSGSNSSEGSDRSAIELFTSIFAPISTTSSPTDGRDTVSFTKLRPGADTLVHSFNVEAYDFTLLHLALLAFEINRADPLYSLFKHQCYWWAAMFIGVIQLDIATRFPNGPQPQPFEFDPQEEQSYYLGNLAEASKAIKEQLKALPPDALTSNSPPANDIAEPEPVPNPNLQSRYRNFKVIGPHHTMIAVIYERYACTYTTTHGRLETFTKEYEAAQEIKRKSELEARVKLETAEAMVVEERRQKEEERRQKEEEQRQKEEERRQKEEALEKNRRLEDQLRILMAKQNLST